MFLFHGCLIYKMNHCKFLESIISRTIQCYHLRYYLQMTSVFTILLYIDLTPKFLNAMNYLCFYSRFTSLPKYSFNSCQRFSIGLRSGDSGGVHHKFIFLSWRYCLAWLEMCLGAKHYKIRLMTSFILSRSNTLCFG